MSGSLLRGSSHHERPATSHRRAGLDRCHTSGPGQRSMDRSGRTRLLGSEYSAEQQDDQDENGLFRAIKAGAQGYLLKNLEAPQLRSMLEGVADRKSTRLNSSH